MSLKFTEDEKAEISGKKLSYSKTKGFFHCKDCMEQFLGSPLHQTMSPRDYGMYEAGQQLFAYPGGEKRMIVVVWCKRCRRLVWDSRHLEPIEWL